ncbi:MAG: mechanosensitive ion channel family protein [Acidobacteriota bacterium]
MADLLPETQVLALVAVGLAVVLLVLRAFARNPWIRKRLTLGILILLATAGAGLILQNTGSVLPGTARTVVGLGVFIAVVLAGIVLLMNRFTGSSVSQKYPAIVQDSLVVGVFAIIAVVLGGDKLLTTSAVGGLIIGLALQDTLGNLFSGLALQVEKPFFVGDWVRMGHLEGCVKEITWRATKIRTKSGHFCVIPNNLISKDTLVNFTHPSPFLRVEKKIGFGYEAHPNHVKRVVLQAMADIPDILREPRPDVLLDTYNDFSIDYRCRFWINEFEFLEPIVDRFMTLLYYRLEREGLKIPFPIRDVRLNQEEGAEDVRRLEFECKVRFIASMDLFSPLSDDERTEIAGCLEKITFAVDEPIIHQGAQGDSMFLIERGQIRVVIEEDSVAHQVAQLSEGHYFGEMALLTGEPRTASAIAVTDVDAYVLRKDTFRGVLVKYPQIAEHLSAVIAERKEGLKTKSDELKSRRNLRREVEKSLLTRIRSFFSLT